MAACLLALLGCFSCTCLCVCVCVGHCADLLFFVPPPNLFVLFLSLVTNRSLREPNSLVVKVAVALVLWLPLTMIPSLGKKSLFQSIRCVCMCLPVCMCFLQFHKHSHTQSHSCTHTHTHSLSLSAPCNVHLMISNYTRFVLGFVCPVPATFDRMRWPGHHNC